MKIVASSALRATALALTLVLLPATLARASAPTARSTASGTLPVGSVGPYVSVGTYVIQVATKLGTPSARLPDGTWLYEDYVAGDRTGTLVVTFVNGRVSSLSLATPSAIAALRAHPDRIGTKTLAAAWKLR